jgi:probable biosynthetic protein (TIGR04098 family)
MPQLQWGGLSEHWLLKELGDMHWSLITAGLGTTSDKVTDSAGERLYAAFVRLRWSPFPAARRRTHTSPATGSLGAP